MKVQVLFFGATADAAGSRRLGVNIDDGQTVGEIVERLKIDHPPLSSHNLLIAVNEEYVGPETALKHGDEMAVFTAVSGG